MRPSASFGLALLASFALCAFSAPAHTADAGDLQGLYTGSLHANNIQQAEDLEIDMTVTNLQPNGKFTASFGDSSAPGKVSPTGKVTINGKLTGGGVNTQFKMKAQLSATGQFLVGTASLKGTILGVNVTDKYTVSMAVAAD